MVALHKVLVGKLGAVDRLAAASVAARKVAALDHEVSNYPMKDGRLVVQRFARGAEALLSRLVARSTM